MTLEVLAIAERYRVGPCVGQGGMGTVFRGSDLASGRTVAIKRLRTDGPHRDAASIERFKREGEALARLNHPNIVQMLDVVSEGETSYLVMEFVPGGSLEDVLENSPEPLPIDRVLSLALDLCDALTRAHRLGIIHRDLKPSNVLLTDDGAPKLTDFGAAYIAGQRRITADCAVIGTTEYVSPEALRGEAVDARADIWAFGVLLFELLTQRRPFAHDTVAETLHSITYSAPPELETLRPDCPPALAELVYRMLAKDRSQRIPSTRQVGAELDKIAHGGSNSTPRPDPRAALGAMQRTPPVRSNLPAETSTFVGRQPELADLQHSLSDPNTRLVTIVAPGGMGKTRLALELGHRLLASTLATEPDERDWRLANGLYLVELAPLSSPEFIISAIAEAVGIQFYPGRDAKQQLFDHLRDKRALLVLDNFEHLLEGADIVAELLRAAKGVTVVATSRERLGLLGETLLPLSGMELPESVSAQHAFDFGAVRLFVQAARQQRPDFKLDENEADAVVRICRLVHGVPLGILLAASWVSTLSLAEIALEISHGLDFLAAELRDLPERQRSMRAVFDHSWALLGEPERAALAGVSIFRGGFTREAAEEVAGASIRVLATLIHKSLIGRDPKSGRYRVHELLRQYAEEKLGATPEAERRTLDTHGAYFASYVQAREANLKSPSPSRAIAELEAELDNVRAAWSRMLAHAELDETSRTLETLYLFYARRASLAEGEAVFGALVDSLCDHDSHALERTRLLGRTLSFRAMFLRQQGRYALATELLERALGLLNEHEHPRERAFALVAFGSTQVKAGNLAEGTRLGEEGLRLYRVAGDAWGMANALETLGRLYGTAGDFAKAESAYRESANIQRGAGLLESGSVGLGVAFAQQGKFTEGSRLMREALDTFEAAGDLWNKMLCQMNLANIERNLGNYASAEALTKSCLEFTREVGNWDHEAWASYQLGNVLKEQERYESAEIHFRAGLERSLQIGDAGKIALGRLEFGNLASIRGDYEEAWRQLQESLSGFESCGQIWGIALALDLMGYVACQEGDLEKAGPLFARALRTTLERKLYPFATNVVAGMALWFARRGEQEKAAELLGFARENPATERHTLTRRVAPLWAELSAEMPAETLAAAVERGRALAWDALAIRFAGSVGESASTS